MWTVCKSIYNFQSLLELMTKNPPPPPPDLGLALILEKFIKLCKLLITYGRHFWGVVKGVRLLQTVHMAFTSNYFYWSFMVHWLCKYLVTSPNIVFPCMVRQDILCMSALLFLLLCSILYINSVIQNILMLVFFSIILVSFDFS
jgi:hypothetical protein